MMSSSIKLQYYSLQFNRGILCSYNYFTTKYRYSPKTFTSLGAAFDQRDYGTPFNYLLPKVISLKYFPNDITYFSHFLIFEIHFLIFEIHFLILASI